MIAHTFNPAYRRARTTASPIGAHSASDQRRRRKQADEALKAAKALRDASNHTCTEELLLRLREIQRGFLLAQKENNFTARIEEAFREGDR